MTAMIKRTLAHGEHKVHTGIEGFDQITRGGLPRGRATLVIGGPGSGKTVFALQFLSHGARDAQEPGIFVAFEESALNIKTNASSFGWGLGDLSERQLFFMDAMPTSDLIESGNFDLTGLLAIISAQSERMGAKRIVFDALDVLLSLLQNNAIRQREIRRLHEWLLSSGLTGLITGKSSSEGLNAPDPQFVSGMQFMVTCAIVLTHRVEQGVSQRNLRVQKYRGSSFDENETPFVIGSSGLDMAVTSQAVVKETKVNSTRLTSGVKRLDTMLSGGFYRGSAVLITGFPGTAKTTLSGAFAEAACKRGERTMFIEFDSNGAEVVRNLASVGIRLQSYVTNGRLRLVSARAFPGSAEVLLVRIKALALEHRARCLVVDPISTMTRAGNESTASSVIERLIDWTKSEGITLLSTCLVDEMSGQTEGRAPLQIATLADTWIHLSYLVQAGERNRGISIIKSRGTAHSNQVRELILSEKGVTLTDISTAGGEVLMGTMRWEREQADRVAAEVAKVANKLARVTLDAEEAVLAVRNKSLQTELLAKQVEKSLLVHTTERTTGENSRESRRLRELRGADATQSVPKRRRP